MSLFCGLTGALIALAAFAIARGGERIGMAQAALGVVESMTGMAGLSGLDKTDLTILWQLRLPRVLLAMVAGAGLALAGVAMQAILRNPLASPFTIGVSPAAAFGASIAILYGLDKSLGQFAVIGSAFVSALVCAALVIGIALVHGASSSSIILAGIAMSYLFGALTASVQFLATDERLSTIIHWTFGTLNRSVWSEVGFALLVVCSVFPILLRYAWGYNALTFGGEEVAGSLGFRLRRMRLVSITAAVMATATIVSFTGVIGFVGLVAPHLARLMIGADHRLLLPFSALTGALLLLVADTIGRLLFAPVVLPVGIVVAFVGVPVFLHLIIAQRRQYFS